MLTAVSAVTGESVVVDTRYGALRGTRKTTGPDSYVDQFLSIPFARPPVGKIPAVVCLESSLYHVIFVFVFPLLTSLVLAVLLLFLLFQML